MVVHYVVRRLWVRIMYGTSLIDLVQMPTHTQDGANIRNTEEAV